MNEWKTVGLVSFAVNVILVALLFFAVFYVKSIVEDKNANIASLERELEVAKSYRTQESEPVATVADDNERVREQAKEQAEAVVEPKPEPELVQKQPAAQKPASQPVQQTDYKKKLASYKPSLEADYEYIYYMYEGDPGPDFLLEQMSNAEVADGYEEMYEKADAILNKVYGILKDNLPANEFQALQTEQRAWLSRVTKGKETRLAAGGSSARLDIALGLGDETRERTKYLMETYFGFVDYYGE